MAAKWDLRKSRNGQYYFTLKAGNSEIILTSPRFDNKHDAVEGIKSAADNAPYASRYERFTTTTNHPIFMLKTVNGRILGTSELYDTESERDSGIDAVRTHGPTAILKDNTGE
ncbi:MAG: hypothetical protein CL946_06655 [Ectothiorhodospiraceae bacterium]|nr:hypothetical protein [Ectothiorhodospiraceae bacterium]